MIETDVFQTRQEFMETLKTNPGVIIIKFGAEWCGPCQKIEPQVVEYMNAMPSSIRCIMIDIDKAFDAYAYLKSKKIVNGIPVCLAYYKDNIHFVPDEVVIGTNESEIKQFFANCIVEVR